MNAVVRCVRANQWVYQVSSAYVVRFEAAISRYESQLIAILSTKALACFCRYVG